MLLKSKIWNKHSINMTLMKNKMFSNEDSSIKQLMVKIR